MRTSNGLVIQHRPGMCSCPRVSFVIDFSEDYDSESEAVWNSEIDDARTKYGITDEMVWG